MLVLSRKLQEQIKIGDDITITVVKVNNRQIRLGIEAPRDVRVVRAELEQRDSNSAESKQPASTVSTEFPAQTATPDMQLRVVDGIQSAAEMSAQSDNVEPEPSRPSGQPLSVFMGKMRVNASERIVDSLPAADLMTAT